MLQVRVEHHEREGADVGGIGVDERTWGVAEECGSKGLHDAVDLLRLARHVQCAEDEAERLVDAQPAEGEAAHEASQRSHGEGRGRRQHRADLFGREAGELEEHRRHLHRVTALLHRVTGSLT